MEMPPTDDPWDVPPWAVKGECVRLSFFAWDLSAVITGLTFRFWALKAVIFLRILCGSQTFPEAYSLMSAAVKRTL